MSFGDRKRQILKRLRIVIAQARGSYAQQDQRYECCAHSLALKTVGPPVRQCVVTSCAGALPQVQFAMTSEIANSLSGREMKSGDCEIYSTHSQHSQVLMAHSRTHAIVNQTQALRFTPEPTWCPQPAAGT